MNILKFDKFNEAKCKEFTDFDIETKVIVDELTGNTYNVFFGKNSKSNDYLTTNFSGKYATAIRGIDPSKNDIWMHAKGVPGSHLIIKTIKDDLIPLNVIKSAAIITKKNSKVKDIQNSEIVYCKKDYVSKTPIGEVKSLLDNINKKIDLGESLSQNELDILEKTKPKEGRVFVDYKNSEIILI
jgi:hypothetical protein